MILSLSASVSLKGQGVVTPLEVRQAGLLFLVLLCAYLANGMFQDVTIVPMVHMTLFFFAGLTVGQFLKHHPAGQDLQSASRRIVHSSTQHTSIPQNL